jgi:GntR family transcriptional regulator, colanic acid and biofilm gene transcriptional regulator
MARGTLSSAISRNRASAPGRTLHKEDALTRPDTLAGAAYERVSESLMDGAYIPGDRIGSRSLATDLGISATPAREAMLRLVGEGALEMLNARVVVVPELSAARLQEIYFIRYGLEPAVAAIGAASLSDEDIRKLERSQRRMTEAYEIRDYRLVFHENRQFHFRIYASANMPLAMTFIRAAWLRMGPTFRLLYPSLAAPSDALRIHDEIIAAARDRNNEALGNGIRRDLERGEALLKRIIIR